MRCLHCIRKAHVRGVCEPRYRQIRAMISKGTTTDAAAVNDGLWLPKNMKPLSEKDRVKKASKKDICPACKQPNNAHREDEDGYPVCPGQESKAGITVPESVDTASVMSQITFMAHRLRFLEAQNAALHAVISKIRDAMESL